MILSNDISAFMVWFVQQVVSIFTFVYSTLDSITFANTSLLKVIIFINIIVPFLYVILTIPQSGASAIHDYNINVQKENKKAHDKANKSIRRKK